MKIIRDNSESFNIDRSVVTVGTFDGLHLGHKEIIDKLLEKSRELNTVSVVVTFDPHPREVVASDGSVDLITSTKEKIEILSGLGVDYVYIIEFNKEFSALSADEFIRKYIVEKLNAVYVVLGYDHKFGKDRQGDEALLKKIGTEAGFNITIVSPKKTDDNVISSTKIRNAVSSGNIENANKYLGRNYAISGKVTEGAKRGRTLGFPTANVGYYGKNKLIPATGVYAVICYLKGQKFYGVLNIGCRPTFDDTFSLVIEAHLFDFNQNVYGEEIKVEFLKKLRNEIKFNSKDDLIEQMEQDKREAKEFISKLVN